MPGAGKSAVGRELAAASGRKFIDTDEWVESMFGAPLQTLLDCDGPAGLKRKEQFAILHHRFPPGAVIATGGSVVYSHAAIAALRELGPMVYLQVSLTTVQQRVGNWERRGFVKRPGQSLEDVYLERLPLYEAAADMTVDGNEGTPKQLAAALAPLLAGAG